MCFRILGFEFESSSEPFGVFNLVQGISVFGFQLVQFYLDTKNGDEMLYYAIACGLFGILASIVLLFFPFRKKVKPEEERARLMHEHDKQKEQWT